MKVASQETRSQLDNKQRAIKRFSQIVLEALIPQEERIATKPTKSSNLKRLDTKKRDSTIKKNRNRKNNE